MPADERVDYLHDVGARIWVPFTAVGEDVSQMEFRASGFGPMQVVLIDSAPFRVSRTPKQIEQADPDLLKAYLVCSGNKSVISQDDRQAVLSPGEFALYDTRRPCEQVQGTIPGRRLQLLTFMFPPSMLPLPRNGIRELVATRVPASPGLGELTSQFLLQLARNVDSYTPAEVARLSTAALEVLATRLARELDVGDWGTPEARKHAMLTTVQGFICQHLSDPGMSPAAVAAAHHLSLRALHQAVGLNDTAPGQENIKGGLAFTVDIQGDPVTGLVGYRARSHAGLIDLDRIGHYEPLDFWEPVYRRGGTGIILDPNDFYILASKESVVVPADHAAEMLAYDSLVGEFRVHYAGFFDPGFGLGETGGAGSRAVLEVRAHEVPFLIEDGQVVGRLVYERLTQRPDKLYGQGIGSNYQSQGLRLGKQFKRD